MTKQTVLLVEDDSSVSHVIVTALKAEGMAVDSCKSVTERDDLLAGGKYDLLITDVGLGEADGISTLDAVRVQDPDLPVIVISAQNTLNTAVRASETSAFEYFPKPFDLDELVEVVRQAMKPRSAELAVENIDDESLPLVGRSPAMQDVYRMIARLLRNDLSVLILGESGTGKELVAEAIHTLGHRKAGPFIAVNMAAIPTDLIEAELFGHEKGAFTGAVNSAAGKFEQARGGTLFLDEIGDMPMHAQTRLLRALQSGEISRVGGKGLVKLDVRIIAATNQDFEKLIAAGKFREDLYYRLAEIVIKIPALAERSGDTSLLARHFQKKFADEINPAVKGIAPDALAALEAWKWPGNVRELENRIKRAVIMADGKMIAASDLDLEAAEDEVSDLLNLKAAREAADRAAIIRAISQTDGNISNAAKLLGISRPTLYDLLKQYQLQQAS